MQVIGQVGVICDGGPLRDAANIYMIVHVVVIVDKSGGGRPLV